MSEPKIPQALVLDPETVSHLIERAARAKAINDCSHVITDLSMDESNLGYVGHIYHYWLGPELKVVSRNNAQIERLTKYYIESYSKRFIDASAKGPAEALENLRGLDRTFASNWEVILRKHRKVSSFNYNQTKDLNWWINFTYATKVTAELAFVLLSPLGKYHFVKGAVGGVLFTITCKICEASPWDAKVVALGWDKVASESGDVIEDIGVNKAETYASKYIKKYAEAQTNKAAKELAGTFSREPILAQIGAEKGMALKAVKGLGVIAGLLFMRDDLKRAYYDGYVPTKKKSSR
jgi:hypothetical protein